MQLESSHLNSLVLQVASEFDKCDAAILFCSVIRNTMNASSDIDILLICDAIPEGGPTSPNLRA